MCSHPLKAVKLWAWSEWDLEAHCLLGVGGGGPPPPPTSDITRGRKGFDLHQEPMN